MFGLGKHHTPYGVIIDVHSGSVGMAIIHSEPSLAKPEVLFAHREYIKITEQPDTATLIRALRHALFAASLQLSQEGLKALKAYDGGGRIGKILLVCGAPWATTVTRFIHVEDKEPFVVTEEKVRSLVLEAERRDATELQTASLLKELNISLVERSIINTTVNGYALHDPYGKKANELSLAHISGLVPQAILDAVADIEEKVLTHTTRTSHTFALVLFCVVRDLYPKMRHALLIDIAGEATELSVMQDEVLMETCVFPFGTHTFLRMLATELGTFPDEALTHLKEFGPEMPEPIQTAVKKVTENYTRALAEHLTLLEAHYSIPRHILLTTSRNLHTYFDPIMRTALEKYIGPHGTFVSLNTDLLGDTATDIQTQDIFFFVEARFFHKLHGCGEII